MKIGDIVKGLPDSTCCVIDERMSKGVIVHARNNEIKITVIEHNDNMYGSFWVNTECFEVVGQQKKFSREDVFKLLTKGCKRAILEYDLCDADLCGANLRGANFDFSCLPLHCGGLKLIVDKRLACQIAYHLCSFRCEDEEYIKMRNSMLNFANQFHRVNECGKLEPYPLPDKKEKTNET